LQSSLARDAETRNYESGRSMIDSDNI
jgi:hypothetical protein